jgi:F0F1-type ATP synthase membrane subunit b/b'
VVVPEAGRRFTAGARPSALDPGHDPLDGADCIGPDALGDGPEQDHLGAKAVMNRDHRIARTAALIAFSVSLLIASETFASEGELAIFPDLRMLLLVVFFAVLVFPVNALILKPIFRALDEREEKITGTRRHGDRLIAEADDDLQRYEQAVREARRDAENDRKQTLARARAEGAATTADVRNESKREVGRAREEVVAALDEARTELRVRSEELAKEVAARALGRALS